MEIAAESDAIAVNVLTEAAASGSEDVIDAVVAIMFDVLDEDTVRVQTPARDFAAVALAFHVDTMGMRRGGDMPCLVGDGLDHAYKIPKPWEGRWLSCPRGKALPQIASFLVFPRH